MFATHTRRLLSLYFAVVWAVVLAVVFVPPVLAQAEPPNPADLSAVLNYLITGGAAIVAAVVVSWAAENIPAFNAQSAAAKMLEQGVISIGLGVGAWYLVTYQPAFIVSAAPVFAVLVAALAPLIVNQVYHAIAKKA